MIDEQKIMGLIPAKALGCLGSVDDQELKNLIDEGYAFPWDELGKYQTIASLLPLSLQLETPEAKLKDVIALRLIKLTEEQRQKKAQEEEVRKAIKEVEQNIEEIPVQIDQISETASEDISFKEYDQSEVEQFNLDEVKLPDISEVDLNQESEVIENNFSDPLESENTQVSEDNLESTAVPSFEAVSVAENQKLEEVDEELNQEFLSDAITEITDQSELIPSDASEEKAAKENIETNFAEPPKKTLNEKIYMALEQDFDALKSSVDESERKVTRNLLWAYVAIAVLLALLIFSFFKFTSDIKSLERKVDELDKKVTSELFNPHNFNSDFSARS